MVHFLVSFFTLRYEIQERLMGGQNYWMIDRIYMGERVFFERWNTPESAQKRLDELNGFIN